jgi:hypothetical protein
VETVAVVAAVDLVGWEGVAVTAVAAVTPVDAAGLEGVAATAVLAVKVVGDEAPSLAGKVEALAEVAVWAASAAQAAAGSAGHTLARIRRQFCSCRTFPRPYVRTSLLSH